MCACHILPMRFCTPFVACPCFVSRREGVPFHHHIYPISIDPHAPRNVDASHVLATAPWFIRVIVSIVRLVDHALHGWLELVVHICDGGVGWCHSDLRVALLVWIQR